MCKSMKICELNQRLHTILDAGTGSTGLHAIDNCINPVIVAITDNSGDVHYFPVVGAYFAGEKSVVPEEIKRSIIINCGEEIEK